MISQFGPQANLSTLWAIPLPNTHPHTSIALSWASILLVTELWVVSNDCLSHIQRTGSISFWLSWGGYSVLQVSALTGWMVRALAICAEDPEFKTAFARDFSKTPSVYPAGNEYWALESRIGGGEGNERNKTHPSFTIVGLSSWPYCTLRVSMSSKHNTPGFYHLESPPDLWNWKIWG